MTARRCLVPAVLLLLVAAGACRDRPPHRSPGPQAGRPVCQAPVSEVSGFRLVQTVRMPELDHVGIRRSYRGSGGTWLHFTAGVSGEFTEGAVEAGSFTVSTGRPARLFGRGSDWVLLWEEDPPCSQMTASGNGFSRRAFVRTLEEAGVIGARV